MTLNLENNEQFTGLILLTGVDKPGIASALFDTLSPFSISIVDIEQLIISDRLILTVLIILNPAHQKAIESDLEECASVNDVDIATLFTSRSMINAKSELIEIDINSDKLHPKSIAAVTAALNASGGNIESIARVANDPLTIRFTVSEISLQDVTDLVAPINFEDRSKVYVKAHG